MKPFGWALLVASVVSANGAVACPETEYVYGLVGHYPADGAVGVPLDSPIVLYTKTEDSERSDYFADETFVELRRPGGELVTELQEDELVPFEEGASAFAFVPEEPLLPDTTYQVHAGTRIHDGRVVDASDFTFTTGPAARDTPLRIEGDWRVRYALGTKPIYECEQCGPCAEVGAEPAAVAQLTLPVVRDGFSDGFLSAVVRVSKVNADGSEKTLSYLPIDELVPGVAKTIDGALELDDGKPYRACFTLEIVDGRGDEKRDRYCTDEVFETPPESPSGPEPEAGLAGTAGESASPGGDDERSSSGCSTSGRISGSSSGALVALAVLAAFSGRRRRDSKRATAPAR